MGSLGGSKKGLLLEANLEANRSLLSLVLQLDRPAVNASLVSAD